MRLRILILILLFAAAPAHAVTNGSFELGGGWSFSGDASLAGTLLGFAPTDGVNQALLTTVVAASDPFAPISGNDASNAASLEITLGLPAGTIQSPTGAAGREGSMLWQTFTASTASVLSIDWNLFSMEPNAVPIDDDFAFISLTGIANTSPGSVLSSIFIPTTNPAIDATGWQNSQFILGAGTYQLAIGVFDAGDDANPSALGLDNIVLNTIPEPGTGLLLALGLAGISLHRDRRRRRLTARAASGA